LPASSGEVREAAPGIEKKDIRALIVYPDNVYSPADVQRMEASVHPLVDAIASGAKLTKADASRQADPDSARQAVIQQIEESLKGRNRAAFVGMTFLPSSAGNRPVACPPAGCGCDQQGHGVSCSCGLLKNNLGTFCMCLLCYEKQVLSDLPESDLRMAAPGRVAPRGVVIIAAAPPEAPAQLRQKLADAAVNIIQTEAWPAGLAVKTKSVPN